MDEESLNKITEILIKTGHLNIKTAVRIYEIEKYNQPKTTYLEYLDHENNLVTNPLDISIQEISENIKEQDETS